MALRLSGACLAQYYITIRDEALGQTEDEIAFEAADPAAARKEAVRLLPEIARDDIARTAGAVAANHRYVARLRDDQGDIAAITLTMTLTHLRQPE